MTNTNFTRLLYRWNIVIVTSQGLIDQTYSIRSSTQRPWCLKCPAESVALPRCLRLGIAVAVHSRRSHSLAWRFQAVPSPKHDQVAWVKSLDPLQGIHWFHEFIHTQHGWNVKASPNRQQATSLTSKMLGDRRCHWISWPGPRSREKCSSQVGCPET